MAFTLWALLEAALLIVNAVAVLNEQRFLVKIGWAVDNVQGFGERPGVKSQIINLIHATRTLMRVPLIFFNIIAIIGLINDMDYIRALEHPTLKIPYEILNKKFRAAQKTIDREVSHVQHVTGELEKCLKKEDLCIGDVSGIVENLLEKLNALKRKAESAVSEETEAASLIKRRVDHLKVGVNASTSTTALQQWRKIRMDRLIVDYLLRAGCLETAKQVAEKSGIDYMTNVPVFVAAQDVGVALSSKEPSKCLEWCYDNKSKLRRIKSTLELKVRRLEFIELIRRGQRLDAVRYARRYFSNLEKDQEAEFARLMGLLAFPVDNTLERYRDLLSDNCWTDLLKDFQSENFRLYQLNNQSAFSACLQCGLSALKTPQCYSASTQEHKLKPGAAGGEGQTKARACPICLPDVRVLARPLPYAHVSQSRLVCAYSGEPLNENNPPLMLPNGTIYGQNSLMLLAAYNNGQIICPRTKQVFALKDAEKVFIM